MIPAAGQDLGEVEDGVALSGVKLVQGGAQPRVDLAGRENAGRTHQSRTRLDPSDRHEVSLHERGETGEAGEHVTVSPPLNNMSTNKYSDLQFNVSQRFKKLQVRPVQEPRGVEIERGDHRPGLGFGLRARERLHAAAGA